MVNEARAITADEVNGYKPTGKKHRPPKTKAKVLIAEATAKSEPSIVAAAESAKERVYIRLPNGENQQVLMSLKATIDDFKGDTEVVLVLGADASKQAIKLPSKIDTKEPALTKLAEAVGADNVIVR